MLLLKNRQLKSPSVELWSPVQVNSKHFQRNNESCLSWNILNLIRIYYLLHQKHTFQSYLPSIRELEVSEKWPAFFSKYSFSLCSVKTYLGLMNSEKPERYSINLPSPLRFVSYILVYKFLCLGGITTTSGAGTVLSPSPLSIQFKVIALFSIKIPRIKSAAIRSIIASGLDYRWITNWRLPAQKMIVFTE